MLGLAVLVPGSSTASTEPGTWSPGPSMSVERVWHTQTALADGRILVASGQTRAGIFTDTAEVYDPATGIWTPTGTMNGRRAVASAALLSSGKVLVAGGDRNQCAGAVGTAELYDPSTNAWSSVQAMPTPALAPAVAVLTDGRALLAGGFQTPVTNTCAAGANVGVTRVFDPVSESWSTAAPMLTPRHLALAATLSDGRVLVAGGWSDTARLTSTEIYDPVTNSWTPAAPMAQGHAYGTLTLLADGRVLVVGGQTGASGSIAGAEVYDAQTNSWQSTGPMIERRENHAASVLPDGDVVVAGGINSSFFRITGAERYDPTTNQWRGTAALPSENSDAQTSLLPNGDVFLTGGQGPGGAEEGTEIYDPSASRPVFVAREGTRLLLDGESYRPIGLNIYNANSNGWCWYPMDGTVLDDSLTAIGPGKNAMRAWFFQQLATTNGARDWTAFDRTLATAAAHGYKVVATLIDQWGNCGATNGQGYGYKDADWYETGYTQPDPSATVSYRDWVQEVVARYKDNPTILAWQLVNEPEVGHCTTVPEPTAASLLYAFASDVSGLIKSNDSNHLVSLGTIGSGQCGAQAGDYETVMSVPTLDLCEFHDYTPGELVPGDQWNGLQVRINQCNELAKPLLVGELGVAPNQVGGTLADRAAVVSSKLCAQLAAGVAGVLLWAWDKDGSLLDNYDIGPGDPVLDSLAPWSDASYSCSPPVSPTGAVAAAGDGTAAVGWLPPAADGGSPVTSYEVRSAPGDVVKTVGASATSATLTGLANGTAYTFTITARNAAGTSVPSAATRAVTPTPGYPPPVAMTRTASAAGSTTLSAGSDPALLGGTTTSITVPSGTSGGSVSLTQSGATEPAPNGYLLGGVEVTIAAPAATPVNPLTITFTVAPAAGRPLDNATLGSTEIFRSEGGSPPALVGNCAGPAGQAQPDPCISSRQYATIAGATYARLTVLASSASVWKTASPKPATVVVSDGGYTPQNVAVQQGAYVNWSFSGKKLHSVTDSVGLAASGAPWFNSGAKSSGGYRFAFPAAGTFAYRSTSKGDSMTGSVAVPVLVAPARGRTTSTFSVIWSASPPGGLVFDVQYRFKAAGSPSWTAWTSWQTGVTRTNAGFVPSKGAGTYAFHARVRNPSTGRASAYSPVDVITAS